MRVSALLVPTFMAIGAAAFAQPYGWVPGSTVDSPKSGNKMCIVDLSNGDLLTDPEGWQFTTDSAGADPLIPGFSEDGSIAYVLVGGDHDVDPTGHIYVFETEPVISALRADETPPGPIQTILLPDRKSVV